MAQIGKWRHAAAESPETPKTTMVEMRSCSLIVGANSRLAAAAARARGDRPRDDDGEVLLSATMSTSTPADWAMRAFS